MGSLLDIHEIYRDGRSIGQLKVTQDGLMTVFECECGYVSAGVLRLAGVSGGKYAKIGVLAPEEGKLKMKKSYTRAALDSLALDPDSGFFAVLSGEEYDGAEKNKNEMESEEQKSELSEKVLEESPKKTADIKLERFTENPREDTPGKLQIISSEPPASGDDTVTPHAVLTPEPPPQNEPAADTQEPAAHGEWEPIHDPSVLFEDVDIANACKGAKGALTMEKDGVTLLAIPVLPGEPFPMMPVFCFGDSVRISGREHIVFKSKNGNFVI